MKKIKIPLLVVAMFAFTSCATVFGGHITEAQRTKPKAGEPSRQLRAVALIFDILSPAGLIIDFADCAIYKPTGNGKAAAQK